MTTRIPVQCAACSRFTGPNKAGAPACEAFPGGIPGEIVFGGIDHRRHRPGDHGVRFALADTDEARRAFANWQVVFAPEEYASGHQEAGSQEGGDAA